MKTRSSPRAEQRQPVALLGYYPPRLVARPLTGQDRRAKLDLLPRHPAPEALILGSSRVMTLAPSTLERLTGGLRSFNAGSANEFSRVTSELTLHLAFHLRFQG